MRRISIAGLFIGLILLTGLIIGQGWAIVSQTFAEMGGSVLGLSFYYLVPIFCGMMSWWYLFERGKAPSLPFCLYAVWISFSINWLLPVGQIGGEIARARMMLKRHVPSGRAIASVVGDQTLQVATQALYTLMGFLLLIYTQVGNGQNNTNLFIAGGLGILIFAISSSLFYWLQHAGLFKLFARIARRFPMLPSDESFAESAIHIDESLRAMYRRRDRLLLAFLWRFAFRITAAGETWFAFQLLNYPISVVEALILESIGQGVRSAAFFIPGGLGAQEGIIVLVGTALGIPPEIALASSLCKRVRELVLGVPGLVAWQVEEGKRAFTRRSE